MKLHSVIYLLLTSLAFCMSSCSRTYDAINNGGYVNVKQMGAKGDGRNDDTKAIMRAFNLANRNHSGVYFPIGTYVISRNTIVKNKRYALMVPSNIDMVGEDQNKSIIQLGPGHGGFSRMVNLIDVNDINISNLSFDGNLAAQAKQEEHQGGVWLQNADNIAIKNCSFYNTGGDGIGIRGPKDPSENVVVRNCLFRDNGRNGITLGSGFDNVIIDSCFFDATNMHASPIDSEPEAGSCTRVVMSNNVVVNKSERSTAITLGGHVPVTGYQVYNNQLENCGFHLVKSYDVAIYNNQVETTDDRTAINLIYESKRVSISGNKIKSKKDGVAIITTKTSGPSDVVVDSNIITTAMDISHGIRIQGGKNIKILNNTINTTNKASRSSSIFVRSTRDVDNIDIRYNNIENYKDGLTVGTHQNYTVSNMKFEKNKIEILENGKEIDCKKCNGNLNSQVRVSISENDVKKKKI